MRWADLGRQRGTKTTAAVENALGLRRRESSARCPFQDASAQVNGLDGVAGGPFAVLAHVNQDRLGIARQPPSRLLHRDFADTKPDLINHLQKPGRMLHTAKR